MTDFEMLEKVFKKFENTMVHPMPDPCPCVGITLRKSKDTLFYIFDEKGNLENIQLLGYCKPDSVWDEEVGQVAQHTDEQGYLKFVKIHPLTRIEKKK